RVGARRAGLTIVGVSIALAVGFDTAHLAQTPRGWAYLAVALGALAASWHDARGAELLLAAALALGGAAAAWLLDGTALALVWSAETIALAWAGRSKARLRLLLGGVAWEG